MKYIASALISFVGAIILARRIVKRIIGRAWKQYTKKQLLSSVSLRLASPLSNNILATAIQIIINDKTLRLCITFKMRLSSGINEITELSVSISSIVNTIEDIIVNGSAFLQMFIPLLSFKDIKLPREKKATASTSPLINKSILKSHNTSISRGNIKPDLLIRKYITGDITQTIIKSRTYHNG